MATLFPQALKHEWSPLFESKRRNAKRKALKKRIKQNNIYNEKYYRVYRAFFDRRTEKDVIDWLEANQPYKQAILKAIRHEIEREASRSEKD